MPSKQSELAHVGAVVVSKRRGVRNLRLRLTPSGEVRITIPSWLPYEAGFQFARKKQDWILKAQAVSPTVIIKHGSKIGKSHRVAASRLTDSIRVQGQVISVPAAQLPADHRYQSLIRACERAIKKDAENLLPLRLTTLAAQHGFSFEGHAVKRMRSRWGSCSTDGKITLSTYLIQLPWYLIDYVLLHELAHTVHHNHSAQFWQMLEGHLPNTKALRKELRAYQPSIIPQ